MPPFSTDRMKQALRQQLESLEAAGVRQLPSPTRRPQRRGKAAQATGPPSAIARGAAVR